ATPHYLQVAQDNLAAGVKSGNTPDWRMLKREGLDTTDADAKYFEKEFLDNATKNLAPSPQRDDLLKQLGDASKGAADAYHKFHDFIAQTFLDKPDAPNAHDGVKPQFRNDHYAMGEDEYNWALKNNLRMDKTAAQLYEEAWPIVQQTQADMVKLAHEIGPKHNLTLPADDQAAVRAVLNELSKDYPKTDAEE